MAHIMIVDDEVGARTLIGIMVARAGHTVVKAADAREGLRLLKHETPDAFIIDDRMPGMDGIDLCQELRRRQKTRHTPILLMVSRNADQLTLMRESGADRTLAKPIISLDIVNILRRVLHGVLGPVIAVYCLDDRWRSYGALQHHGFDVIWHTNPRIGPLAAAPHLCIVDRADGLEVCRQLREQFPMTAKLMVLPQLNSDATLRALQAGATDVIGATPTEAEFLHKVRVLLGPFLQNARN